jgi:hypothetical protein
MLSRKDADTLIAAIESMVDLSLDPPSVCSRCGKPTIGIPADVGESVEACPVCDTAVVAARKARSAAPPK